LPGENKKNPEDLETQLAVWPLLYQQPEASFFFA
jgi:hypothetical protein